MPFKPALWAVGAWLITLLLLIGCFAVIGMIPTGQPPVRDWRGVLIDQRNRISLSRFQLVLWTLLVVSAIITEGTFNALWSIDDPLGLAIPKELWILVGLSSATAVAAPVVLGTKNPDGAADNALSTKDPGGHAWRDMFYGDDKGNDDQVDFSKVQQFFLTVVLIVIYGIEIGAILMNPGVPPGDTKMSIRMFFPALDAGFLGLMAVSQVAYISYKALPQNKTDAAKP